MPACLILLLARTSRWPMVGGRDQERRGDRGGVEAQDGLQDHRGPDARIDRRMGASKHQEQPVVGNLRFAHGRGLQLLVH